MSHEMIRDVKSMDVVKTHGGGKGCSRFVKAEGCGQVNFTAQFWWSPGVEPFPLLLCGFLYKNLLCFTESKMSVLYRRQCGTLVGAPPFKHNTGTSFLEWPRILKFNSGCSSPVSLATSGFCSNLLQFLVIIFKYILLYAYIKRRKMVMNLGFASLRSFLLQINNKR